MEGGGGSGMGGEPPHNLLDAGAEAYYPAVASPCPFQPPPPLQVYYPPPPPMVVSMQLPALPLQTGYPMSAAGTVVVDGPATRGVVLSLVPAHATEADVAHAMALFGAARAVDASAVASRGVATVHFFDLRAAEHAVAAVREQHMRQQCRLSQLYAASAAWPPTPLPQAWDWNHDDVPGGLILGQAVWAHFAAASTLPDDGASRGSLVVLNSLPDVSLSELQDAFQAFGDLKDARESAQRPNRRFLEFYDTRDAAAALTALNGKDLFGHRLAIEFTRPSCPGVRRRAAGYAPHQYAAAAAATPPRLQAAWRPTSSSSSGSGGTGKTTEPVVLLRRNSSKSGAGTSHARRGKGSVKNAVTPATWSPEASASPSSSTSGKLPQKGAGRAGSSRGPKGGWEARFVFKEPDLTTPAAAAVAGSCNDARTTVMIRNIPNKYSQKLLLNMLDTHCICMNRRIEAGEDEDEDEGEGQPFSSYDFLYLPIDFNNKCNVGYGFVNLTSPEAAVRLYRAFHKQPWEVYNSRKICQVTYARVQGLEALREHFKNSKFPCDSDEYLPSVFSPPRDGVRLTEPVPLVPRSPAPPPTKRPAASVDPLAVELTAPPSSSGDGDGDGDGDGASSTSMSASALSDQADDEGLGEELRWLHAD